MEDFYTYDHHTNTIVDIYCNPVNLKEEIKNYSTKFPTQLFVTKILFSDRIDVFYTLNGFCFDTYNQYLKSIKNYKILNKVRNIVLPINVPADFFEYSLKSLKYQDLLVIEITYQNNDSKILYYENKFLDPKQFSNYIKTYIVYNFDTKELLDIDLPVYVKYKEFWESVKKLYADVIYEIIYADKYKRYYFQNTIFDIYDKDSSSEIRDYGCCCSNCKSEEDLFIAEINDNPFVKRLLCLKCIRTKSYKLESECECICLKYYDEYLDDIFYNTVEQKCICGHSECSYVCKLKKLINKTSNS